jgi:hypothetical protein
MQVRPEVKVAAVAGGVQGNRYTNQFLSFSRLTVMAQMGEGQVSQSARSSSKPMR